MASSETKITGDSPGGFDLFGDDEAFAMDGDTIVIGADGDDDVAVNSGHVYVFRRIGFVWSLEQKLKASDTQDSDQFGNSVSLDGDPALCGAWSDDDNIGSAWVFERDGSNRNLVNKITASHGELNDFYGSAVAIRGGSMVVGSPGDDD